MMRLIKGNRDHLEGRVTIYSQWDRTESPHSNENSQLPPGLGENPFIGFYLSIDPTDIAEQLNFNVERIHEILEQSKEHMKNKGINVSENSYLPIFVMPIYFADEAEVLSKQGDVLSIGNYSSLNRCSNALAMGMSMYFMKLMDQKNPQGMDISEKQKEKNIPLETYKDFNGEDIREYLLKTFVTPMLDAKSYQETERSNELKRNFLAFSEGASFSVDVVDLCNTLGNEETNLDLVDLYTRKIQAVHVEEYEVAAKIRDQII
tara:strand:- start:489 stop:1274 length:786 start_codon:yes stop_codon:yes gene_type:complete